MARGPEAKLVQDPLTKFMRENEILHKKKDTGPYTTSSGWPDLEIFPGKKVIFFIECKAPGKKADPLQEHIHGILREAGYEVFVVDNAELGRAIIKKRCKLK